MAITLKHTALHQTWMENFWILFFRQKTIWISGSIRFCCFRQPSAYKFDLNLNPTVKSHSYYSKCIFQSHFEFVTAIQLENTDRVFSGMVWRVCWNWRCNVCARTILYLFFLKRAGFSSLSPMILQRIWLQSTPPKPRMLQIVSAWRMNFIRMQSSTGFTLHDFNQKNSIPFNKRECIFFACFRCIDEFNQIYRYSLFTFYVWVMLLSSSSLVTMQFLSVEYSYFFLFASWWNNFPFLKWENVFIHSILTN